MANFLFDNFNIPLRDKSQTAIASKSWLDTNPMQGSECNFFETALQAALKREQSLNWLIKVIHASLDPATIVTTAVHETAQLLAADQALIVHGLPPQDWRLVKSWVPVSEPEHQAIAEVLRSTQDLAIALGRSESVQLCRIEGTETLTAGPTYLFVPLTHQLAAWGMLVLVRYQGNRWHESEVQFLETVADQVAIALHQAEMHQKIQQINVQLEAEITTRTAELQSALDCETLLKQITDRVRDSLDERDILQTAVDALGQALGLDCCDTVLYDAQRLTSVIDYEYTRPGVPSRQGQVLPMAERPEIYGQLWAGQTFAFCQVAPSSIRNHSAILACPIVDGEKIFGDLWLFRSTQATYSDLEIRLVKQVANQCAIAIRQAQLYQAVQGQVQALEALNCLKDDFLSTISHELRTPISNVKMAVEMMALILDQYPVLANLMLDAHMTTLGQYLKIVQQECDHELSLLEDLLELQHLDAGTRPLALSRVNLADWLPHVLEGFEGQTQGQGQTLRIRVAETLTAFTTDLFGLSRILRELMTNACKYTPVGGLIGVEADWVDGRLQIRVSNSGVEIPLESIGYVFDKFYRVPSADPWRHSGMGLGLALVKGLTEYLGGSIGVMSDRDGTCFTLQLPCGALAELPRGESFADR